MTAEPVRQDRLLASFGRRRGRRLRTGKQALIDTLLPEVSVELPGANILDLQKLFIFSSPLEGEDQGGGGVQKAESHRTTPHPNLPPQGGKEYWLEIGFGGGEHLAHQAGLHPDIGIIGCEPYIPGIAGLLSYISEHKVGNVRVYTDDARHLMERLPDACLSRVFILYPDPWPKARHHKRRLVSKPTLDALSRVMKPGSLLRLATDDADYATWMLEQLLPHPDFTWTAKGCDDWLKPPADWISTRYEQKALAGRPTYLEFKRL